MYEEENKEVKTITKWVIRGVIGLLLLITLFSSFGTISAGEKGIKTRFGAVTGKIYDAGLYFKAPFVESVVAMNVQTQKGAMPFINIK